MNAKRFLSAIAVLPAFVGTLSGCSETTKEAAPLPEIVSAVTFPYIKGNLLLEFDPVSGEATTLAESETGLFLALDTDESTKEDIEDDQAAFQNTADPEYFVFANKQTLHIYDLNTRREHTVFSFKDDLVFSEIEQALVPAPESYICDIQKVITLDEDARLERKIIYKDLRKVYVKTSLRSDCNPSNQNFNYWQIDIEESQNDESYTIRRKNLLEHTHSHTHFHDHDDPDYELADEHNHEHALEDGERDPNNNNEIFDRKNHEHEHSHIHDFVYPEDHFHDFLSKDEIDRVHNNPKNHEIVFETFPVLVGKKTTINSIDEARMYTGKPVVDLNNRTFGYLGVNTTENALKFYAFPPNEDPQTFKVELLWTLESNEFNGLDNTQDVLSDTEKLIGDFNRSSIFEYINRNILINTHNKLFYFPLKQLFDDDESELREASLLNPVFESQLSESLQGRYQYNDDTNELLITEGLQVWTVEFTQDSYTQPKLIKDYGDNNNSANSPSRIEAMFSGSSIIVIKTFENTDPATRSIVVLERNGLESQTIFNKTDNQISASTVKFRDYIASLMNIFSKTYFNITDSASQSLQSIVLNPGFNTEESNILDSIRIPYSLDLRNSSDIVPYIQSDFLQTTPNSLRRPSLFLETESDTLLDFGEIPKEVIAANRVVILNNLYGLIDLTGSDNTNNVYFFSVGKTSFNLDNEFRVMKKLP